ncbi:MAG: hypothetical protein ACLFRV_12055 [Acidimicrobiales bacterium]
MFDTLDMEARLEELVGSLQPGELSGPDAVSLMERFARLGRLAEAGVALCASRVEESQAWRRSGHRDAAGFVAARTGQHRRGAKDSLLVGSQLPRAGGLDGAVRGGELSRDQAAEIAHVLRERPDLDAEAELLAVARRGSLRALRGACADVLSRGHGADERDRRAKAERTCSSSVDRHGRWRLSASLPTLDGALVDRALDVFQAAAFDDARRAGLREPFSAYRADALVRMARAALGDDGARVGCSSDSGDAETRSTRPRRGVPRGRSSSVRHAIVVTVPHAAFWRGHTTAGETCEVPGVGPVPVSEVHKLVDDDPIIKTVVTKGRDITALGTATRSIREDLRLAVALSSDGTCEVPDCEARRFVELDHEWEYHKGGPTTYDNLRPLCTFHHDLRTNHGYELRGTPGNHEWIAPDGTVVAAERSATPV